MLASLLSRRPGLAALFLMLASCLAQAQALVMPRSSMLLSGQTRVFRLQGVAAGDGTEAGQSRPHGTWVWSILEDGVGTIDAATGCYRAPEVAEPCTVKVRATCRRRPGTTAEALVLVLPFQPFELVDKVLGPGWLEPHSSAWPFLDLTTGGRDEQPGRVFAWGHGWVPGPATHYAGYGLPCTLHWTPAPEAQAQLLSYEDGQQLIRKDVTGQSAQVITSTGGLRRFQVEALHQLPGRADAWESSRQEASLHFRGLVPKAGNALLAPGHEDGVGLAARFQAPFGLALVTGRCVGSRLETHCLVSDPQAHVIRKVSSKGAVSTPWGQPGQAGHLDTASAPGSRDGRSHDSRFHGPTFLLAGSIFHNQYLNRSWLCLVADSGNHCLRVLHGDGAVTTLAGVPGQAGYRNGRPWDQALFNNPQGLAEDTAGNVYVADQGNFVIRRLSPSGQVDTLAGTAGEPGSADGTGPEARFTDLRGMAICRSALEAESLYAADGHAIRRITLPEGQVTTPVGVVATPGFKEVTRGEAADRREALAEPCLNRPCGLADGYLGLEIADQGNHCVRRWCFTKSTLTTTVGDPSLAENRWGLTRDGLEGPLDETYAACPAPTALVSSHRYPDTYFITTGCCVAELYSARDLQDRLGQLELICSPGSLGQACECRFEVEAWSRAEQPSARPFRYTVDFLEPDGTLATRAEGSGTAPDQVSVQGQFTQRGAGRVVLRCVTDEGVSAGGQCRVAID